MRIAWIAIALTCCLIGCGSTGPKELPPEPGIVGTIYDDEGSPVAGVPVGVVFAVPTIPPDGIRQARDHHRVYIEFLLELDSWCWLQIYDYRERLVNILVEGEELLAGRHGIPWFLDDADDEKIPNGLYTAQLDVHRIGYSDRQMFRIWINNDSINYGEDIGAHAITNGAGRFRIPYAELPIGELVPVGPDEVAVPDSLQLQSHAPVGTARVWAKVTDMSADIEVELLLAE